MLGHDHDLIADQLPEVRAARANRSTNLLNRYFKRLLQVERTANRGDYLIN